MGKERKRASAEKAHRAAQDAARWGLPVGNRKQPQKDAHAVRHPHKRSPSFSPEPTGNYVASTDNKSRVVDMLHGEIVNRLADELEACGYKVANTGLTDDAKPDLVVFGKKQAIIEVKTGCTLQDIKNILGQLFLYDYRLGAPGKTRMKAVMPSDINGESAAVLRHYGICLIRWEKRGGDIVFKGLKTSFPERKRILGDKGETEARQII